MLNRNAARHLLLVASILLCAFVYAGYTLATRGGGDPAADGPAGEEAGGAMRLIPAADGDSFSLSPPAPSSSMRPPRPASLPPPPSSGGEFITGLVPGNAGAPAGDSAAASSPGGTRLPLPGFSAAAENAPPVLSPPEAAGAGGAAASGGADFAASSGDDFGGGFAASSGDAKSGEAPDEGDFGDFAALPGFDASAPVPPPFAAGGGMGRPPGGGMPSAPASPARPSSLAPPSSASPVSAPAAGGAGTVLRPPPAAGAADAGASAAAPSGRPDFAPPPPPTTPPARTPLPASLVAPGVSASPGAPSGVPARTPPPASADGRGGAGGQASSDPGSDSLRIYVVAPGDTLSSIAMRELGSGFLADNIFLLNRDVIDDPNHLLVGVKIRLPYANPGLAPGEAGGGVLSGPASPGGDVPGRRVPNAGLGTTHTVVRGDTLSSIAQQYYGSSALWQVLYEANRATLPNPNQLTVGTELTIPPE